MDHFNIERATLDHHLKPLAEAGLIGQIQVTIDKVKNILCVPLQSVSLKMETEIDSNQILAIIGDDISIDVDHQEIQERVQREVHRKSITTEDAKAIIRTVFEHRGRATKNLCASCGRIRKMTDLKLCDVCLKPACSKCIQEVKRTDDQIELICDRCVRDQFGS